MAMTAKLPDMSNPNPEVIKKQSQAFNQMFQQQQAAKQQQQQQIPNMLSSFLNTTGIQYNDLVYHFPKGQGLNDLVAKYEAMAQGAMGNAGIFTQKDLQGVIPYGVRRDGTQYYVNPAVNSNPNYTQAGENQLTQVGDVLGKLGAFSTPQEAQQFVSYAKAASSPQFMNQLNGLVANGDMKGAINTVMQQFGKPAVENLLKQGGASGETLSGVGTAFAAYNVFAGWDQMNPAQRSLAVAGLGLQAYRFGTGENLANKVLVNANTPGGPNLTVGGALSLLGTGVNVYSLIKNWDQLDAFQRITFGLGTAAQVATTAKNFGLLGAGTSGTAVASANAAQLAAAGFTSAPSAGVGAIIGPANALPQGYTAVASSTQPGMVIATPSGTAGSAATSAGAKGISTLGAAAGAAAVAYGAYQVYQGWGEGGSKGAVNGALGGTSMACGLYGLGASGVLGSGAMAAAAMNPFVLGGVVAFSIASNCLPLGGGKSEDQQARDQMRSFGQKLNLVDKDYSVMLADGSRADVGTDGHGGQHEFRNPDIATQAGNKVRTLGAYDVDYTNDLDFAANLGTTALTRLCAGGKGKAIDQFAGQLANASISNIGYGQDMTPENFTKMQANVKGFFAQVGIKSKEDAYALANQAFAEGRINEMDLVSTHQGIDLTFDSADEGYKTATNLMGGRNKGIEVAHQVPASAPNYTSYSSSKIDPEKLQFINSKPLMIPAGASAPTSFATIAGSDAAAQLVASKHPLSGMELDPGFYMGPETSSYFDDALKNWNNNVGGYMFEKVLNLSKEEVKQRNQQRYA